jgi:hypothetical protein
MSSVYTPSPSSAVTELTITNPTDGDALTAASNNLAPSKLADYVQRVFNLARLASVLNWSALQTQPNATSAAPSIIIGKPDGSLILMLTTAAAAVTNIQSNPALGALPWSNAATSVANPTCGVWTGSKWVVGCKGGNIYTSTDGSTWTLQTSGTASDITGLAVNGAGTLLVAVGTTVILTSPDGVTWTSRSGAYASVGQINRVMWSSAASLWVIQAQGSAGTGGGVIQTSPDGIAWTNRTTNLTSAGANFTAYTLLTVITQVPFAAGTQLVAVACTDAGAANGAIFTSPDGLTWTNRQAFVIATWAPQFIGWNGNACIALGGLGRCATSFDGVTWTYRQASGSTQVPSSAASTWLSLQACNVMIVYNTLLSGSVPLLEISAIAAPV